MPDIIAYVISAVVPVISGAILYFLKKHFKQIEKQVCETEERQTQKDLLMLKCLKAIGELTVANAIAVKTGHQNGEMEKAKEEFESVDKDLNAFLMEQAIKKTNKKRGG